MNESKLDSQVREYFEHINDFKFIQFDNTQKKRTRKYRKNEGVPDWIGYYKDVRPCPIVFIELKVPGGRVSDNQMDFVAESMRDGALHKICWSLEEVDTFLNYIRKNYPPRKNPDCYLESGC